MSEVDTRIGGVSGAAAHKPPDALDTANDVMARSTSATQNPAILLRDATKALVDLAKTTNPTAAETAAFAKLNALVTKLTQPAAIEAAKTWVASGAAKVRVTTEVAKAVAAPNTAEVAKAAAKPATVATPPAAVQVDEPSGEATLTKPISMRALAANAFGISEAQVGDTHMQLLAQTNDSLGTLGPEAMVPAGTKVSLSASPRVADLQRRANTKALENIDTVLAEAAAAKPGTPNALTDEQVLALREQSASLKVQGKAIQEQLPNLRAYDAIGRSEASRNQAIEAAKGTDPAKAAPLLAAARKELDDALKTAKGSSAAEGALLKRRADLSMLEANIASQPAAITAYREKTGGKRVDELGDLPDDIKDAATKALSSVSNGFKAAKTDLQTSATKYREQAKAATSPDEKTRLEGLAKGLDTEISGLAAREQSALGMVHASVGHTAGQMASIANELDAIAPGSSALLKGAETTNVGDDGVEAGVLGWLGSTKVESMSADQLKAFKANLAKLPPDQQNKALAVVAKYGEAGAANGDVNSLNVSRQVLEQKAADDPKGPWASQAATTKGNFILQLGNPTGAAAAFKEAGEKAASIADPSTRQMAEIGAVMGQASALSAATREGNPTSKAAAANMLRELRQGVEKRQPPLLDKSALAQLNLAEVNGYLGPNMSKEAEASLASLKKNYGGNGADGKPEVPWLNKALIDFEANNREGGVAAFAQTLMSEMTGRQTAGQKLAIVATTTATGAAVGAAGLGVGAIPGAIVGLAAGGIGLLGYNAIEGWDNARQAGQTGLARQTWVETLTDGVSIATDLVGLAAPVKAMSLVGKASLTAAAKGGINAEAKAIIESNMLRIERELGSTAFAKLTPEAAEKAARQLVLKEFSAETLKYGGVAMPVAGLATASAGLAKGFIDIENNASMSPAEKTNAKKQLLAGLGKALVDSAPQMVLQAALHRSATTGLPADVRKAVTAAATSKSQAIVLDDATFKSQLRQAAESEIKAKNLKGPDADAVRAHYEGIIKNGDGHIDLGTGNVFINGSAGAKTGQILRHEVAHRDFHQLPMSERQKLVDAFNKDPNKAAIKKMVDDANPHSGGFTPLQYIDEYQAMVRAETGSAAAGLTGGSETFNKALTGAGLKGVKDISTDKLLKNGKLDLGRFRSRSGERLSMGASGIDALKPLAADFTPLKSVLDVADRVPGLKEKVAAIKPERVLELKGAKSRAWENVLAQGTPPKATEALMAALADPSPEALAALVKKNPGEVTSVPARPATASTATQPPVTSTSAADIDKLGSAGANLKRVFDKGTPEQKAETAEFAKALSGDFGSLTLNKYALTEAFAKADDVGRAAMTATMKEAVAARASIKNMQSGASAFNTALETALKPPMNAAGVKGLRSLADNLPGVKLEGGAKDSVIKAAKAAIDKGDAASMEQLATLAKNVDSIKTPEAAARLAELAKLGNASNQVGELLMQPSPERVAALRSLANRSGDAGADFNAASLAKKAVRGEDMQKFLGTEASPELMHALVTAKAPGKTALEKMALELSIHESSSAPALRAANRHTGAKLQEFAEQYADTAGRANSDLRTPALRAAHAEYRIDMAARSGEAPTGLKLGNEEKVGQGPTNWKLGQPMGIESTHIGQAFKATGTTTAFAGYKMTELLEKLPALIRSNDPKRTAETLKEAYRELVSLNGDAAVSGKALNNPQLAEQLKMLESQLSRIVNLPPAQQLQALKDGLKT